MHKERLSKKRNA